ncbi:hypothetical protein MMC34_003513 [Xylographa carneopallida]|nr:hypothetical protein [Xylographa carneopallida]
MSAWHNLSINVNLSNDFEDQSEGLTSSTSSSFASSSASFTSATTSPASSRRPSRCSESWLPQYHSGPSSMASTAPATPNSATSFTMAAFGNDANAPTVGPAMEWSPQDGSQLPSGVDDDTWSTIAKSDSIQKSQYLDWSTVYSQLDHTALSSDVFRQFPHWSGLPDLPTFPNESPFLSNLDFDPLKATGSQDDTFWIPNNPYQQPLTIVPSQTLVHRPKTPLPMLAEAFQTPVKIERHEWQGQNHEFSSPLPSPVKTGSNSGSLSPSCPSLTTVTKRRVKSGTRGITYDFIRNKSGKKFYQRLGASDTNGQPGEILPIDHIAEEKPKKNTCGFRDSSTGFVCTQSFKRGEHLTRHRKIHTRKPTMPCPVCVTWEKFTRTSPTRISAGRDDNLVTHIKKTHMTESSSGRNPRGRADPITGEKIVITNEWLKSHGIDMDRPVKKQIKQERR